MKKKKIGKNNNKEVFQQSDNLIFKHNFNNYSLNNTINNETKEINGELCLICFEVESTKDNPKICLCSCNNYIHFKCLKEYITKKSEILDKPNVKTYNFSKFNCDVCLSSYPVRFRIREYNRIYELVDLAMPSECDYIILESLDYIKDNANKKTIHIVNLNEGEIHIGRNDSNYIIDTDITVSRNHAILKYNKDNGKLILENLSEKFGTLILIKGNIKMKEKKIYLQVGKSFIVANVEKDNSNDSSLTS